MFAAILAAYLATPDLSGEWQRYFAIWPVEVDAYSVTEPGNGKMRYPKWGWVDRRWYTWTDDETDEVAPSERQKICGLQSC